MTRAVEVVVERAPSGGSGWSLRVGGAERFLFGSEFRAIVWVREQLEAAGADSAERGRVIRLALRELDRQRRAEITAEVAL